MAKTKRRGTIEELRARTDARREAGHERDAARYRLAAELADLARFSIPEDAYELGSPFLRFALSQDVVAPVAAYLGLVPILFGIDVWYSPPATESGFRNAQLWHADGDDTAQGQGLGALERHRA